MSFDIIKCIKYELLQVSSHLTNGETCFKVIIFHVYDVNNV